MMSQKALRGNGSSLGSALILSNDDQKGNTQKSHFISCYDEIGCQTWERTLEYVLDLPHKSVYQPPLSIGVDFIRKLLKQHVPRLDAGRELEHGDRLDAGRELEHGDRRGVLITDDGCGLNIAAVDRSSVCGDIRVVREPLLIESFTVFSSARFNACVWKGRWMYEVTLETSGVQQLGWATIACPFTNTKGVGDAEDSYAFDGGRVS